MRGGLAVPVHHMGLLSPHGGERMSVLADTFLEDTEMCCSHQQFLWGSRDSLPDSLLSAIASVDPGRSGRTHTAGPGEHSGSQKRMTLLFKLHLRSRSRQGADYTHTAVWGAGRPQPLRVGVSLTCTGRCCLLAQIGALGQVHPSFPPSQPVPPTSHRDEDLQLQLALHLSRQEQEKVVG